ncbi:hypothetical protein [Nonlabens antarcticus]|nr:hypothetical protein [Nonlabens antarcticus]
MTRSSIFLKVPESESVLAISLNNSKTDFYYAFAKAEQFKVYNK